jgi:phosphonate transport system ATP-binding protein
MSEGHVPTVPAVPAVSLADVRVLYGDTEALAGVDLRIGVGERVALLGPSGAGKSTLLGLLTGRVAPTAGTVRVFGLDVTALPTRDLRRLRRRIGAMAQGLDLVGQLRVIHNVQAARLGELSWLRALVALLRPTADERTRDVLQRVDLLDRVHDRTDTLSGGQQQRVALARVLLTEPELVLADEPVSSLDPGYAAEVLSLLVGPGSAATPEPPPGARTLVLSLHDPDLARRFADRLIGLQAGRVVFDLPAKAVDDRQLAALYEREPSAPLP